MRSCCSVSTTPNSPSCTGSRRSATWTTSLGNTGDDERLRAGLEACVRHGDLRRLLVRAVLRRRHGLLSGIVRALGVESLADVAERAARNFPHVRKVVLREPSYEDVGRRQVLASGADANEYARWLDVLIAVDALGAPRLSAFLGRVCQELEGSQHVDEAAWLRAQHAAMGTDAGSSAASDGTPRVERSSAVFCELELVDAAQLLDASALERLVRTPGPQRGLIPQNPYSYVLPSASNMFVVRATNVTSDLVFLDKQSFALSFLSHRLHPSNFNWYNREALRNPLKPGETVAAGVFQSHLHEFVGRGEVIGEYIDRGDFERLDPIQVTVRSLQGAIYGTQGYRYSLIYMRLLRERDAR